MTFTELEYVLMLAGAVLLWRASEAGRKAHIESDRANRYADFLMEVGKGQGSVVKGDDGIWEFKRKTNQ